jgi:hypothetical protein
MKNLGPYEHDVFSHSSTLKFILASLETIALVKEKYTHSQAWLKLSGKMTSRETVETAT